MQKINTLKIIQCITWLVIIFIVIKYINKDILVIFECLLVLISCEICNYYAKSKNSKIINVLIELMFFTIILIFF